MKWLYPVVVLLGKAQGKGKVIKNKSDRKPAVPIYDLSIQLNNGQPYPLINLKGKKILLVNTASNCGYTNQYAELQKLYTHSKEDLVIVAFPANDFQDQEKGDDEAINQFCQVNYGISFPLAKKSVVVKSGEQNEIFRWLTDAGLNGWNNQGPTWNFSKYLINEEGVLTHYFDPAVSPLSTEMLEAVHRG